MKGWAKIRAAMARQVGRFLVTLINDAGPVQRLQGEVLDGEVLDRVQRMTDYGFSSHPHPGAEGLLVAVAGSRGQSVVIAVGDRRYRLQLEEGEVALHDDLEQAVHLTRDGIRLVSPLRVQVEAPTIEITAEDEMVLTSEKIVLASDHVFLAGEDGAKAIARHDDTIVAGKIVATSTKAKSL